MLLIIPLLYIFILTWRWVYLWHTAVLACLHQNMTQSVHMHSSSTLGGEYIFYDWSCVFHFWLALVSSVPSLTARTIPNSKEKFRLTPCQCVTARKNFSITPRRGLDPPQTSPPSQPLEVTMILTASSKPELLTARANVWIRTSSLAKTWFSYHGHGDHIIRTFYFTPLFF